MKTAISIPDDLFADADALARRMGTSRSELYSRAVREYVSSHASDSVTERLNGLYSGEESLDEFGRAAARRVLEHAEW